MKERRSRIKVAFIAITSFTLLVLGSCQNGNKTVIRTPDDPLPSFMAATNETEPGRIVDSLGRQVLLRGVNVNSHVEYWQYDPDIPTTYTFTEEDADLLATMGWNLVRLAISWSRVEPSPGEYDDAYLEEVAASVAKLRQRGIYTLIYAPAIERSWSIKITI